MEYTPRQAVRIAIKCGKEYKKNFANTKILIIYREREGNHIKAIEIVFRPSNYQHLTGLLLVDSQGVIKDKCSVEFYHKCTGNNLKESEIRFKEDGTTSLKLDALPYLMNLTNITKIVGDYDKSKKWMEADVVAGGVHFCLAVSENTEGEKNTYFPRSGLLEDIRNITKNSSQVLAIFQKKISDKEKYNKLKYAAKGLNIAKLSLPEEIVKEVTIEKESTSCG